MVQRWWTVYLSVDYRTQGQWKRINAIADEVDPKQSGAGSGFGSRDIDWDKPSEAEAKDLKKKLLLAYEKAGFKATATVFKRPKGG